VIWSATSTKERKRGTQQRLNQGRRKDAERTRGRYLRQLKKGGTRTVIQKSLEVGGRKEQSAEEAIGGKKR